MMLRRGSEWRLHLKSYHGWRGPFSEQNLDPLFKAALQFSVILTNLTSVRVVIRNQSAATLALLEACSALQALEKLQVEEQTQTLMGYPISPRAAPDCPWHRWKVALPPTLRTAIVTGNVFNAQTQFSMVAPVLCHLPSSIQHLSVVFGYLGLLPPDFRLTRWNLKSLSVGGGHWVQQSEVILDVLRASTDALDALIVESETVLAALDTMFNQYPGLFMRLRTLTVAPFSVYSFSPFSEGSGQATADARTLFARCSGIHTLIVQHRTTARNELWSSGCDIPEDTRVQSMLRLVLQNLEQAAIPTLRVLKLNLPETLTSAAKELVQDIAHACSSRRIEMAYGPVRALVHGLYWTDW
ncbi:hypothetical protein BKA62DRAFT_699348 [Auriculariales sp. MPI-PUGE-AT-0066]|nr:hypothetical protein BKA62DRAFT_699348 [Auriculariales sp. MPI-PUGE-AT-0066]